MNEVARNVSDELVGDDEIFDINEVDLEEIIEYAPGTPELSCARSSSSMSNRSASAASNSSQSPEMKRKKKKIDTSDILEAILTRSTIMPQPPPMEQDDLSKFLLGLGASMKKFNPVRLAKVKLELSTIVGRAEIENASEIQNEAERSI